MHQVDEPRDRPQRREMTIPGQQRGVFFQRPGQLPLVCGPRGRPADSGGDNLVADVRVQPSDDGVYHGDWVPAVGGGALSASWPPGPVPGRDRPGVPARGARLGVLQPAGRAVPVLAAALEGPQLPAALRAARRRDHRSAGGAQRDQQVGDGPWRRGPAVRQHRWPVSQG